MTMNASQSSAPHTWSFFRSGGVDQVVLRTGQDVARIGELDQKLWMALGMPVMGVEFDHRTAEMIDTDGDGRIRPPEVIAAVKWAQQAFHDLETIIPGADSIPLSAIKDPALLAGAKRVLTNLGKGDATAISMADILDEKNIFSRTRLNGDGVIPPDSTDDPVLQGAIADVLKVMGGVTDRSGKSGVDEGGVNAFFQQAAAWLEWQSRPASDPAIAPMGIDAASTACESMTAVRVKINDYFTRCRLVAYDRRASGAMNRGEGFYDQLAARELTVADSDLAALPLAAITGEQVLTLDKGINPAWEGAVATILDKAVKPLLGPAVTTLTPATWGKLQAALAPFEAWLNARPAAAVAVLGADRLKELMASGAQNAMADLIKKDKALAAENARIMDVEKLIRYHRDLYKLLCNYVNFADFYGGKGALFQTGTLYLDARACALCIHVADEAKHAAMAGMSGAYLAYCEISRPGVEKRSIVAAFTDGDSDNLMVGRNGIFYDREGRDWNATITKVVSNPISVREAFWLPYKKFIRFIEEQIAKRAQSAEAESTAKLSDAATVITHAEPKAVPVAAPAAGRKIDLGTIALIGTAIGGISALVAGLLQTIFGLGYWLPLGVAGMLMLISGPSMLLAWMKLRNRNLGPILDANGWAINTKAMLNVPFGAALTATSRLPPGSVRSLVDPFAPRTRPWKRYVVLVVVLAAWGLAWRAGYLNTILPEAWQCGVVEEAAPAPVE